MKEERYLPKTMELVKIDMDTVVLKCETTGLRYAHTSALRCPRDYRGKVTITWYSNLYGDFIERIKPLEESVDIKFTLVLPKEPGYENL